MNNSYTLTATAHPDYFFSQWSGDCGGTNPTCTLIGLGVGFSGRPSAIGITPQTYRVTAHFTKRPASEVTPTPTSTPNQPPAPPADAGSTWIVSPPEGATVTGAPAFIWKALTDPEGQEVTYQLWVCKDGDFDACAPTTITATVTQRLAAVAGGVGVGLSLLAFGFTRQGRRRLVIVGATLLIGGSGALAACGSSSSGTGSSTDGSSTEVVTSCAAVASDEVCYDISSLEKGDYSWKVIALDGDSQSTVSPVMTFTVE